MKPGYEHMNPGYTLIKFGLDAWRELAKIGSSHLKIIELNKNWNVYYRPNRGTLRKEWVKCNLIWSVVLTRFDDKDEIIHFSNGVCCLLLDGQTEYTFVRYTPSDMYNIILEDIK